jgi:hypothetical protein
MNEKLILLRERMSNHMDAIMSMFKPGAKITVVVRSPGYGDADVIMGDDDFDEVIASIQRAKARPPDFNKGDPLEKQA